jgi:hypothetical protein
MAEITTREPFQAIAAQFSIPASPTLDLMTDGIQNGLVDVRTEATNRYTQDHASGFTGTQNVIVHTVGFGLSNADIAAGGPQNLKTPQKRRRELLYSCYRNPTGASPRRRHQPDPGGDVFVCHAGCSDYGHERDQ